MSLKQKDKLKDGFEDLVINDTGKNFDDDMFIIQDWWLKQFDSLLSQALQKRDEKILNKIKEYRCHMDEIHCSCMEALVEFINN